MEKFGIKKEECICFGDQQNDIEMLKAAGTAYVMATGHPLAKKGGRLRCGITFAGDAGVVVE